MVRKLFVPHKLHVALQTALYVCMAEVHGSIMANMIAFHRHKVDQCGSSDACFSPGSRLSCRGRCWPGPETLCWCSTALSAQRARRQHQQRFFPQQRGHRR